MSNGTMEGALDTVSSQVSEAFGRLTHLQDELRARLQTVAERERNAEERTRTLDELAKRLESRESELHAAEEKFMSRCAELDRRAADIEETHRQQEARANERDARCSEREARCDEREAGCGEREARLSRREDVVGAFQEMLAQMHTALETLAPDRIMAALDAGAAYEDRAKGVQSSAAEGPSAETAETVHDPIGLTAAEQARFFALRDAGKSDAEILAEIYEARAAARSGAAA